MAENDESTGVTVGAAKEQLQESLVQEDAQIKKAALLELDAASIAHTLEGLPLEERLPIWLMLEDEQRPDVLLRMHDDSRQLLLGQLDETGITKLLDALDADDLVELYTDIPEPFQAVAISALDKRQRRFFQAALAFEEGQVGRIADREVASLPANARLRDAWLLLKRRRASSYSHCIYLVDKQGKYRGAIPFDRLAGGSASDVVIDLVDEDVIALNAQTEIREAVAQLEQVGLAALPVVEQDKLVGQLAMDTVLATHKEELEAQIMAKVGLQEGEDLFAPVWQAAKNRSTWLGINLLTAFLAAWTIGLFEATVEQVVALAVLMPIVASMGGIAGSQTLTLVIRGMALGQISSASVNPLSIKEVQVGLLNAALWSLVIGVATLAWFADPWLGLVIMIAIVVNMLCGAYAAVWIPVFLKRLDIDPALSGSVILTTVTD
ncbi:MAG: magnesium transporter, partial [Pseudomonadales bacterium]|nr:magnesium transporter [Pseudomonadales bacterium]